MNHIIKISLLIFSLCLIMLPSAAQATFVTPKRVMIDQGKNTGVVTIMNRTNKAYVYTFDFEDRAQSPSGESLLLKEDETTPGYRSAKDIMIMSPRQVVVQPGESQKIRIMARRPANLPNGEYHSHLLIKPTPLESAKAKEAGEAAAKKGLGGSLQVLAYVSIPVFIRQGNTDLDFAVSNTRLQEENGKRTIALTIDNNSSRSLYAKLELECHAPDATVTKTGISVLKMYAEAKQLNLNVTIPKKTPPLDGCQKLNLNFYGMQDFEYPNKLIKSVPLN